MTKIFSFFAAIVAALGVTVGVYNHENKKVLKTLRECKLMNVAFITQWISSQDMPEYTVDYTAIYLRGSDLPIYRKLRFFANPMEVVCLAVFDKATNKQVASEYFKCLKIDAELGNDTFIEFPFEA